MIRLRVRCCPAAACDMKSSSDTTPFVVRRLLASRSSRSRRWAISRAWLASSTTTNWSPAIGTPVRPSTCTGIAGPASLTCLPRSSSRARTRPECRPQMKSSPTCSVPLCTRIVATGPLPGSSCASTTAPVAFLSGFDLRSSTSDCRSTWSSSSDTLVPFFAETAVDSVVPPNSSSTTPCCRRSCFTRMGLASGRSTLLIATIIGTPAFLACEIASMVCGITESLAATTRMTMSVTCAPRARMAVNASWPGVSRKVICFLLGSVT